MLVHSVRLFPALLSSAADPNPTAKRLNQLAGELKVGVIDMHAALEKKPELLPGRVHPNNAGAGEMAKTAYKAITGRSAPTAAKK